MCDFVCVKGGSELKGYPINKAWLQTLDYFSLLQANCYAKFAIILLHPNKQLIIQIERKCFGSEVRRNIMVTESIMWILNDSLIRN